MSATTWFIIAIVGFSLAGIAFIAAVFMFIKMNIPAIIGDLTGKTVAREIKAMRDANALSGDKRFRSSRVNMERGTLTEKVNQTFEESNVGNSPTESLSSTATEVLSDNVTEVLNSNETEVLSNNATEVLTGGTTVLTQTEELEEIVDKPVPFKVVYNQILIHSDEVI